MADLKNSAAKVLGYNEIARKKAEADHNWGYYSKLVENYPGYEEQVGHTSHIAKEYPNWKAF